MAPGRILQVKMVFIQIASRLRFSSRGMLNMFEGEKYSAVFCESWRDIGRGGFAVAGISDLDGRRSIRCQRDQPFSDFLGRLRMRLR